LGLTLIRKSQGVRRKRKPTVALVLAGGAVSGGAFKVGGLKALDDFLVGRKVTDLDLYVGLSAGSILAVSLAGGITPDEMLKVIEGIQVRGILPEISAIGGCFVMIESRSPSHDQERLVTEREFNKSSGKNRGKNHNRSER
jgi:hypothetical protein